ncbi:MAG TPA: hypothetical protein VFH50_07110 [Acidimicrobiales bacterium]|nr:hypothetical protein [Acidimicrobiales bacterium]
MSILAHAFGARYDLPVPLLYFVTGGAAVVFLSFLLVLPREVAVPEQPEAPDGSFVPRNRPVPAAIGLLGLGVLVVAGIIGSQEIPENIVPTAFWLVIWIAVPISCGVAGDWTPWMNPFAVLARLADRDGLRRAVLGGAEKVGWPAALGWWPAVVIFLLVASGELIYNGWATRPIVTGVGLLAYAALSALAGMFFGAEAWLTRGEMFSVLYSTWGRLGWLRFGRPGRPGFLGGLDQAFEASVSRITFVFLLLMSVTFDGLLATPAWKRLELQLPPSFSVGSGRYVALAEAAFLTLVLLAWVVFGGFARAVRQVGRLSGPLNRTVVALIPSLLPIAFGYLLAHNFAYLLVNGQLLVPLAGNPFGIHGWQWLPAPFNDSYEIHRQPVPAAAIWYFQVALIVLVHIAAVVVAHRHLARVTRTRVEARRSEWPWIVAMVAYTMTSLWLLAQPIAKEPVTQPAGSPSPPAAVAQLAQTVPAGGVAPATR